MALLLPAYDRKDVKILMLSEDAIITIDPNNPNYQVVDNKIVAKYGYPYFKK